jgi:hypothetical protein
MMVGGAGGAVPFQNKLSLFPAPHGSLALPAQGMLQSVAVAFVVPGVMVSAQFYSIDLRILPRRK